MAKKEKNVELQENEFDVQLSKSEQFVEKNQKSILYAIVGIVLVVAAVWGWNQLSARSNAAAQDDIWPAQALFEQQQYEQALEGFEAVISENGSSKAGNLAKAYAGLCQKNLGKYPEAIEYLADYSGNDNVFAPAVLSALGDCYVEQGEYTKAADTFMKAAKAADNAQFSPIFLKKAGLAYEEAKDKASALKAYQAIKDNWAETSTAQLIDKYIVRVSE